MEDIGIDKFNGPAPKFPDAPTAKHFPGFWAEMTNYAQNQIEYHRKAYFEVSKSIYKKLMKWYEEVYQTNDESELCSKPFTGLADDMHIAMMTQTPILNSELEKWTDYWKDESDMPCINKWGKEYMQNIHSTFSKILEDTNAELNRIE